jgi:hypothetical protein
MSEPGADQLQLLMDYTLFHLGVYATLVAATLAAADHFHKVLSVPLRVAILCFVVAGLSGGVIAASIPESNSWIDFNGRRLGPWGLPLMPYIGWARLEHTSFWLGIFSGLLSYGKAELKRRTRTS